MKGEWTNNMTRIDSLIEFGASVVYRAIYEYQIIRLHR